MKFIKCLAIILTVLTGSDIAYADGVACERPLAASPSKNSRTFRALRGLVDTHRPMLEVALTPEGRDRLEQAVHGSDEEELRLAYEIFDQAKMALTAKIVNGGEYLRQEVIAKRQRAVAWNNQGAAARLEQTLVRLEACLEGRTYGKCYHAWGYLREYLSLDLVPMLPETSPAGEVVPPPITEVDKLDVLGTDELKLKLKRNFEGSYRPGASAFPTRWSRYTPVPNLNRALTSLFLGRPKPLRIYSSAVLEGEALVDGRAQLIHVVLDPNARIFTVQQPTPKGEAPLYYRLALTASGEFRFLRRRPERPSSARAYVYQTHFRY